MIKNELVEEILKQIRQPLWENWYLKEKKGSGTFSVVYRAEAKRSDRVDEAAVKIEPVVLDEGQIVVDEDRRKTTLITKKKAIEHEASIMYELRGCPNIVAYEEELTKELYVDGRFEGYYFLIRMELLENVFDKMRVNTFDYTESNVVKLAEHIGQGLMMAHSKGIIHRDIKPSNFFVSKEGIYKLGDFNISKRTASTRSFAGTEGYMAPEIFSAKVNVNDSYTAQADIYSFGICLYQMMNGGLFPFEETGTLEDAIEKRMQGSRMPAPKNASEEFAKIILKACEYDTARRYRSIGEMLADIELYKKGGKIENGAGGSVGNSHTADDNRNDTNKTVYADAYDGNRTVYAESEPVLNEGLGEKAIKTKKKSRYIIGLIVLLFILLGCTFWVIKAMGDRKEGHVDGEKEVHSSSEYTPTPVLVNTPVPEPGENGEATGTPRPTPTEEVKATSTPIVAPTEEVKLTSTPLPAPTEEVKPTSTLVPALTEEVKPTSTPVPTPTSKPKATSTPKPTKSPTPAVVVKGEVVNLLEECMPYDMSSARIGDVQMCGDVYKDALVLGNAYENWAYFNLKGKYVTIEFDLCHVDGTDSASKTLQIYLDGEQKHVINVGPEDYIQHVVLDVRDVKQLRFNTEQVGLWDNTASMGLANVQAIESSASELENETQDIGGTFLKECMPYDMKGARIGDVQMCGDVYKDALVLGNAYENWAYFNLKGNYATMEFDLCHVDGTDSASKTLQIYLDGEQKHVINVGPEDYIQHVVLDVRGVKQLRFNTEQVGLWDNTASIGLANVQAIK